MSQNLDSVQTITIGMLISFRRKLKTWLHYLEFHNQDKRRVVQGINILDDFLPKNIDKEAWDKELQKDVDRARNTVAMLRKGKKFLPPKDLEEKIHLIMAQIDWT